MIGEYGSRDDADEVGRVVCLSGEAMQADINAVGKHRCLFVWFLGSRWGEYETSLVSFACLIPLRI